MPLIGTETEYGIVAPARPDADPEWLAAQVVAAVDGAATPVLGGVANRFLGNGARVYVDHGHPEYSTPETTSATAAVVAELAGDRIIARAAAAASEAVGTPIRIVKNNTDGHGHSYGHHENYLLARSLDWDALVAPLATHLVTRALFAGAGRVGLGPDAAAPGFQLTQRADFFERVSGLDTTANRGIVNTRDEPHAAPGRWRRLHVITGDAVRNPFALWLTLGSTALVVAALERGFDLGPALADPVASFRTVSRDLTLRAPLPLVGGGAAAALDVQRRILDACAPLAAEVPEGDEVLAEWAGVLDALASDPASTADRLDWTAKLALLTRLRERDGLGWDDPRLHRLDLAWAELDAPAAGSPGRTGRAPRTSRGAEAGAADSRTPASPFTALQRSGRLVDWIDPADVARAETQPPDDTRAHARGRLIAEHGASVVAVTWDSVLLKDAAGRLHPLAMSEPDTWTAADLPGRLAALPPLLGPYTGPAVAGGVPLEDAAP